jgi:multidrug efflux pump subunit AcrA (membrane-fusion protein)
MSPAVKALEAGRTQVGHLIGPHHIAKKLIAALVVGLVVFFSIAKATYRVTGKVVIEPVIQRAAVAPFDGYILEARVRAGDVVGQGQVLCVLDDRDLNLERIKFESQHEQLVRQYHQALGSREPAQVRIVEAQIKQAKAQLALLQDRLSRTRVVAPFDAVVVKGDLSQHLGSPAQRGQILFELAPLESYRVILEVDERDIAQVSVGQRGGMLLSPFPTESLPVTVEKLTPVSTAREGRNYFRVEGRLHSPHARLRPGMEGVGKIEVDRRRLIWIWTHEALDWVRLKLWSWLP